MPTYSAFLKEGDEVELGLRGDPMFPEAYRNARPKGTIHSMFGPRDAQVINVQLDEKFGGKMAHCDVRTLNPYLLFEPTEASYQRALSRADQDPNMQASLRSEHERNETIFRGMRGGAASESVYGNTASLETRLKALEAAHDETRETVMRAVQGLASDISTKAQGEATYSGTMLEMLQKSSGGREGSDIEFRGVDESDASEDDDYFN